DSAPQRGVAVHVVDALKRDVVEGRVAFIAVIGPLAPLRTGEAGQAIPGMAALPLAVDVVPISRNAYVVAGVHVAGKRVVVAFDPDVFFGKKEVAQRGMTREVEARGAGDRRVIGAFAVAPVVAVAARCAWGYGRF